MHLSQLSESERQAHLTALAEAEGFASTEAMLEAAVIDSVAPAICIDCGLTTEMEPDQDRGYCESCGQNKVVSAFILARLI
jgi:hypothetical protein